MSWEEPPPPHAHKKPPKDLEKRKEGTALNGACL